mgnify:FL=1|jgi:hypothetical protein
MADTSTAPESRYIEIDHPWVQHSNMPIYEWTFPPKATDDELVAFAKAREEWAARANYPVAWVVELSNISKATATQRRMFADHLKRFEPHDVEWNAGSALVVPSGWIRGLVTAVFWLSPPKFPNQVFAKRSDAFAWAQYQLEAKIAEHQQRSQVRSRP